MNRIIRNIPNTITCLNLVFGFLAAAMATKGPELICGLEATYWAYIFIGCAAVADFLDGFCARLLKVYSGFGKELDSLCDLVSFGVAPALLVFNAVEASTFGIWKWFAVAIAVCGALRLARFNVDTRQKETFTGLPIPANAIFWIGFTAMVQNYNIDLDGYWWALIILAESWLMISPLRMFSLKFHNYKWKGNTSRWLLIIAAVACVVFLQVPGLFWLICIYVAMSVFLPSSKQD